MISKFFACRDTFNHWFFRMCDSRIKFNVDPFFHRPDDQEPNATRKNDAVRGHADQNLRPICYFRENFVEY